DRRRAGRSRGAVRACVHEAAEDRAADGDGRAAERIAGSLGHCRCPGRLILRGLEAFRADQSAVDERAGDRAGRYEAARTVAVDLDLAAEIDIARDVTAKRDACDAGGGAGVVGGGRRHYDRAVEREVAVERRVRRHADAGRAVALDRDGAGIEIERARQRAVAGNADTGLARARSAEVDGGGRGGNRQEIARQRDGGGVGAGVDQDALCAGGVLVRDRAVEIHVIARVERHRRSRLGDGDAAVRVDGDVARTVVGGGGFDGCGGGGTDFQIGGIGRGGQQSCRRGGQQQTTLQERTLHLDLSFFVSSQH